MSVQDIFELTGAGAGLFSLLWLIATQIFGTYDQRTIRKLMEQQRTDFQRILDLLSAAGAG